MKTSIKSFIEELKSDMTDNCEDCQPSLTVEAAIDFLLKKQLLKEKAIKHYLIIKDFHRTLDKLIEKGINRKVATSIAYKMVAKKWGTAHRWVYSIISYGSSINN